MFVLRVFPARCHQFLCWLVVVATFNGHIDGPRCCWVNFWGSVFLLFLFFVLFWGPSSLGAARIMTNDSDLRAETVAKLLKQNLWGQSVWLKANLGVTHCGFKVKVAMSMQNFSDSLNDHGNRLNNSIKLLPLYLPTTGNQFKRICHHDG